ncbi:MAG: hypothetical protein HOA06_08805 [Chloroflexi bacterium]|nr:hypothetical protein [Chloroflexota bacterium]MBT7004800.1 hypothetical protein [Chloroflexota bacterium]
MLHKAWCNVGLEEAQVRGRGGHTQKIIYGGKPSRSHGPYFTDAVVEGYDGVVFRGDIEIHVRLIGEPTAMTPTLATTGPYYMLWH